MCHKQTQTTSCQPLRALSSEFRARNEICGWALKTRTVGRRHFHQPGGMCSSAVWRSISRTRAFFSMCIFPILSLSRKRTILNSTLLSNLLIIHSQLKWNQELSTICCELCFQIKFFLLGLWPLQKGRLLIKSHLWHFVLPWFECIAFDYLYAVSTVSYSKFSSFLHQSHSWSNLRCQHLKAKHKIVINNLCIIIYILNQSLHTFAQKDLHKAQIPLLTRSQPWLFLYFCL